MAGEYNYSSENRAILYRNSTISALKPLYSAEIYDRVVKVLDIDKKQGDGLLFWNLLGLELILICAAGITLLGNYSGLVIAGLIVSAVNFAVNEPGSILFWEIIILAYMCFGLITAYLLNRKTHNFRVLKVAGGSVTSLFLFGMLLPFIPAILIWTAIIGIPLVFNYRSISRAIVLQAIFKFIFCTGWLIIGNILY